MHNRRHVTPRRYGRCHVTPTRHGVTFAAAAQDDAALAARRGPPFGVCSSASLSGAGPVPAKVHPTGSGDPLAHHLGRRPGAGVAAAAADTAGHRPAGFPRPRRRRRHLHPPPTPAPPPRAPPPPL